jgi:tetraacyldisaccharide 4'-kinase
MATGSAPPAPPLPAPPAPATLGAAAERRLQRLWFSPHGAADALAGLLLWPAHRLVAAVAASRRGRIARRKAEPPAHGVPKVVVIGNLIAGGTGKTPLLIALAHALAQRGWRPGILSRGYRAGGERGAARAVDPDGEAADFGDEPLLVARRTGLPVVVGRDRGAALARLIAEHDCDVVLSDDGLQHVGLRRDLELAVFDARGAGNGRCLPAGPLREPLSGALLVDALVLNGAATPAPLPHSRLFRFDVVPTGWVCLDGARRWTPQAFAAETHGRTLDAVAGIGSPQRFFDLVGTLGIRARAHPLADHAPIDPAWLAGLTGDFIAMTEKDAVKCGGFDPSLRARCVALRIEAVPEAALVDWLEGRLRG